MRSQSSMRHCSEPRPLGSVSLCVVQDIPPLRIGLFLRRFEAVKQVGILHKTLAHFEDFTAAEAGTRQTAICRSKVLSVSEETFARSGPIFSADPFFDQ